MINKEIKSEYNFRFYLFFFVLILSSEFCFLFYISEFLYLIRMNILHLLIVNFSCVKKKSTMRVQLRKQDKLRSLRKYLTGYSKGVSSIDQSINEQINDVNREREREG